MMNDELISGKVQISIGGNPLAIELTVPAKAVKARRMLPVFQGMSSLFAEIGEKGAVANGESTTCQKGCGACCRQLVPLAEIETYQLAELVEAMPEPRRSEIKRRFEAAWHHFTETGLFQRLDACATGSQKEREQVTRDYFQEGVACPFLEDESCSIHENRPLACREYLVTSAVEHCATLSGANIKMVALPAKPSETVRRITNGKNLNRIVNFVPLVLALEWARRYEEEFSEKTGEEWMGNFFRDLTNSEIPHA